MARFQNGLSIAYAQSYFDACKKLPHNVLRDEVTFRQKFMSDPTARGLNYEKINAADNTLRSVRVNRSYRAIVKVPGEEAKNVYTLLWIDSHDEAYAWAEKKRIGVNPVTKVIEIFNVREVEDIPVKVTENPTRPKLFDFVSDDDFNKMDISDNLLWMVRTIEVPEDLEKIKQFVPYSTFECLMFLEAGFPVEEVIDMSEANISENVTCGDPFEDVILSPKNRQHFYIVDSDESAAELNRIMEAPLEEWRLYLHPKQKEFVTKNYDGPALVLGGAGTGKTVVAMHRAKWLAESVYTMPTDKILVTTFTVNLAEDIKANLRILCSDPVFSRIEIVNLDKWVSNFLAKHNVQERLIFGDEVFGCWEKAIINAGLNLNLTVMFYISEYEKVVLANEISNFEKYKSANRVGRGIALNRSQKLQVWDVIQSYRTLLSNTKTIDSASAMIRAKEIIKNSDEKLPYKSVIVDEGQDFGEAAYKLIRAIVGNEHDNDIFIVGDAHQRIYGKKVALRDCGINTVGRKGVLKINYRTTEEIRRFSETIVADIPVDDIDGDTDKRQNYVSLTRGKPPDVLNYASADDERAAIFNYIKRWTALGISPSSICIVARKNRQVAGLRKYLQQNGVMVYEIKNTKADEQSIGGVRVATMHRVKGLEFDCVIIADINEGIVPLETVLNTATDNVNKKELSDNERLLLYVAATRAKKELVVMSYGKPSKLLS